LLEKHRTVNSGMEQKTKNNINWVIKKLEVSWRGGLDVPVSQIQSSQVAAWLAAQTGLKPATYNEISRQLKNIFGLAVHDNVISTSPYDGVLRKRRRTVRKPAVVPTKEQFEAIIERIRSQRLTDHAADSADLVEFLGLAGVGEAEADQLKWSDIDFKKGSMGRVQMRRKKTGEYFEVPMYKYLRPFLQNLHDRRGPPGGADKMFRVKSCRRSLATACRQLGYPHFSPRSLRKFAVTRMLRSGVHPKIVAKCQGHRDGGKLIMDTYSEVINENDERYFESEAAKAR
jgi:integrase